MESINSIELMLFFFLITPCQVSLRSIESLLTRIPTHSILIREAMPTTQPLHSETIQLHKNSS